MDGILVIDKPSGPTSHDVVAVVRRTLRERRIGHTGTLDPMATGVLPLACGRATRLVQFLSPSDKEYEAIIRFGVTTDSYDVTGRETGQNERVPPHAALVAALEAFRGEYLQHPPPVSAKRISGVRAYALARAGEDVRPAAVAVRMPRLDVIDVDGPLVRVRLTCSAGFYVRSLAHDAGQRAGVGACLADLRRLRSGPFTLDDAITLDHLEEAPEAAPVVPIRELLTDMPAVTLTDEGRARVSHGRPVEPGHYEPRPGGAAGPAPSYFRLLDEGGNLLAVGRPEDRPGVLHPSVVLI